MAYSRNNLTMAWSFVGSGPKEWVYSEASITESAVTGAGYISDGVTCGMSKGDLVKVIDPSAPKYKMYQVASTSGTGVTLAVPTAVS